MNFDQSTKQQSLFPSEHSSQAKQSTPQTKHTRKVNRWINNKLDQSLLKRIGKYQT